MSYNDPRQQRGGQAVPPPPPPPPPPPKRPLSFFYGDDGLAPGVSTTVPQESSYTAQQNSSPGGMQRQPSTMNGPRPPPPPPSSYHSGHPQQQLPPPPSHQSQPAYNPQLYAGAGLQTNLPAQYSFYNHSPSSPARTHSMQGPRPYNPAAYRDVGPQSLNVAQSGPVNPSYSPHQLQGQIPEISPALHTQSAFRTSPRVSYGSSAAAQAAANTINRFPISSPSDSSTGRPSPSPRYSESAHDSPNHSYHHSPHASLTTSPPANRPPYPIGPDITYSSDVNRLDVSPSHSAPSTPNHRLSRQSDAGSSSAGRHPQARPLPGPPVDAHHEAYYGGVHLYEHQQRVADDIAEQLAQESLFNQVESAYMNHGDSRRHDSNVDTSRSNSGASRASHDQHVSDAEGGLTTHYVDYDEYDSDAEAAAGLEAMRVAEQEEAEHIRRRSANSGSGSISGGGGLLINGLNTQGLPPPPPLPAHQEGPPEHMTPVSPGTTEDGESWAMDLTSLGGGFEVRMHYGDNLSQLVSGQTEINGFNRHHQSTSSRSSYPLDADGLPVRSSSNTSMTTASVHHAAARVDESGTGGLADPSQHHHRKLSFDDGDDEVDLYDQPSSGYGHDGDELFFQGTIPPRPLPKLPTEENHQSSDFDPSQLLDVGPSSNVPRSISLVSHGRITPQVPQPIRAKTDAEERKRQTMIRASLYGVEGAYEGMSVSQAASSLGLDLPTLPSGKRFKPSALTQRDYDRCHEPWALSGVVSWLKSLASEETELREHTVHEALINLFTYKVSNLNIADAESLSMLALQEMYTGDVLVKEEEWLKFGPGRISGVLYQLTGRGCYAHVLHNYEPPNQRCYAHYCQRTVRKLALGDIGDVKLLDWQTTYRISAEELASADRSKIDLQFRIHEIVQNEEKFLQDLNVIQKVYRESLQNAQPPVLSAKIMQRFMRDVFGKVDAVQKANGDFLLPQLKYRQKEQGPYIREISDIFRDWIRKAKGAYIDYAQHLPKAESMIALEEERNVLFKSFLEAARNHPLAGKLDWKHYLKAPTTKLQRYSLLLSSVISKMPEGEEKANLSTARDEIHAVTQEADTKYGESNRKNNLTQLASKLILRPEMKLVELNLEQPGRELIFEGDLQRNGTTKFTWLESHAILFDHYLVLAKATQQRDAPGGTKYERLDVSKMPIPMDLLVLESADDDAVVKSTVRGIGSVATAAPRPTSDTRSGRSTSNVGARPDTLSQTSTNSSLNRVTSSAQIHNPTILEPRADKESEKTLYPFRIRHLGKEVYTLFAATSEARRQWCEKIIEAKTRHAAQLHLQNAEPFSLRVVADAAFAYDSYSSSQRSILIKGTPLSRAIEEVEGVYANSGRPAPICRARVNCATSYNQQSSNRQVTVVGTDYGVYAADTGNARSWNKVIKALKVTQIAVLEEFNVVLLISDKSLIAYHLDTIANTAGSASGNTDSMRKAPQKLSGARDVNFFVVGRLKDRTLVFYKKREGLSSTFKVLEPVYQKATERKTRLHLMHRGHTDFFREYDDGFYIPAECSGMSVFLSSLAVASSKGFEVLNLEKKTPWSVPDLKQQHVSTIAQRLAEQAPVAMFKLDSVAANGSSYNSSTGYAGSESAALNASVGELICVYEECAVYVNKHGDISRSVVMEFVGRAKEACLIRGYLVLFDNNFVEVRDALNGRLKQVIAGRDVRCIDNGRGLGRDSRTVKFALQHPNNEKNQLVVEMLLTGGR